MGLRKFYPLFLISFAIALFIFASYLLLQTGILRFNYPDHRKFPIRGIDVSHHQKHINWLQVSKHTKSLNSTMFVFPAFAARSPGYCIN